MTQHDAPLGVFEEQVLIAVLRTGDRAYGMRVRQEIESVTGRDVAIGAVYSTLDRLEDKALVRSSRRTIEGSSRRMFEVAPAGAHALAQTKMMRDRLWRGIDLQPLLAKY
ncbi:MAG TPA: helix-turn-helix transcriptional regulator [Longimicrobiales bacterium]|nr:helix-turn-helix transcriptional regulator [Longimicrobiales bacterium]